MILYSTNRLMALVCQGDGERDGHGRKWGLLFPHDHSGLVVVGVGQSSPYSAHIGLNQARKSFGVNKPECH